MSSSRGSVRFPGETESYRAARNQPLDAELDLRRQLETVAAQRRNLPLGGEKTDNYIFEEVNGNPSSAKPVRLSQLFNEGKDCQLFAVSCTDQRFPRLALHARRFSMGLMARRRKPHSQ